MSASSILIIGLAVVLMAPVAWRIWLRRFDPFEPVVVFCVAWGVMFVVRPTAMLLYGDLTYFKVDISGTLPRALVLASVGAVSFLVAYEVRAGRALARRVPAPYEIEMSRGVISALVMTALAFLALLVFFKGLSRFHLLLGGRSDELGQILHGSSTYLWYGSTLIVPAALLSAALALRERHMVLTLLALAVSALALLRIVPVGNRILLLPLLGGALVYLYVRRGARPRLPVLVVMVVGAVVASWVLLLYRDPYARSGVWPFVKSLSHHPERPFRPILRGRDAEMAPALAGALTVVPKALHYRYGSAVLGDLVIRPIPRQLWKGKPKPPGQEVVQTAWPDAYPYLDPAFTPVLFFYWDFWIVGVAVGMAAFGAAARTLYEWFLRFRHDLTAQLIFSAGIWFTVIGARDDPVDAIIIFAFMVFPLALISYLPKWRSGHVSRFLTRVLDAPER